MNIALVLSGGTGTRLASSVPKQYLEAGGKPVIAYCLETLFTHEKIDAVQIVADSAWHGLILSCMENMGLHSGACSHPHAGKVLSGSSFCMEDETSSPELPPCQDSMDLSAGASACSESRGTPPGKSAALKDAEDFRDKFRGFSAPGKTRQLSILNGLRDILQYASGTDSILIHDAARPLLSGELISACLSALDGYDGVLPVLPMKDTVYFSEDKRTVTSLLERQKLFAGQAPEAFRLGKYFEANDRLLPDRIYVINGSTEPAVLAGMDIAMIPGDENNFKITTQADFKRFEAIVQRT